MTAFLLLAAFLVPPAAAQTHDLRVTVSDGRTVYVQTVKVSAGRQANVVGPVAGKDGSRRDMIVNVLLGGRSGKAEELELQYQLELSPGRGAAGQSIQAQGQIATRPGDSLTAVECGIWKVELSLDAGGKPPAAWDASGLGNLRVGADLSRGRGMFRCRQVLQPGVQGNVVDGMLRGGKKFGFIMNVLPAVSPRGAVDLQYQLEYTPVTAPAGVLQIQNQETLAFGRKSSSNSSGYRLDLLVEGRPPGPADAKGRSGSRNPSEPAEKKNAVPLLR